MSLFKRVVAPAVMPALVLWAVIILIVAASTSENNYRTSSEPGWLRTLGKTLWEMHFGFQLLWIVTIGFFTYMWIVSP